MRGIDALENAARRAGRLPDRAQGSRPPPEEEDGPRRPRPTHRPLAGAVVEDRAWPPVPDLADLAAHRARLRRGPRVLLRGGAGAAPGGRDEEGPARRIAGTSRHPRRRVPVRVARLRGDRASLQLLSRGVLPGAAGEAASART